MTLVIICSTFLKLNNSEFFTHTVQLYCVKNKEHFSAGTFNRFCVFLVKVAHKLCRAVNTLADFF